MRTNNKQREDLVPSECQVKPLSLDEAIAHADEVAGDCSTACRREHKQLANWLRELKNRRNGGGYDAKLREVLKKVLDAVKHLSRTHNDNLPEDVCAVLGGIAFDANAALAEPATTEKSLVAGNSAKLREALRDCLDFIMRLDRAFNPFMQNLLENAIAKATAALSAPPRNCDRFNTGDTIKDSEDAYGAWLRYCDDPTIPPSCKVESAFRQWILATAKL